MVSRSSSPTQHRMAIFAIAMPTILGLLLRLQASQGLDLRDMPGPAGVKMIAELARGNTGRDWCTWLIACLLPLTQNDILQATQLLITLGGVGCIVAVCVAGNVLGGWRAGLSAGLLAACWSPLLFTSLVIGADAPSCALTWMGLAACWLGAQKGWRGLPLVALGAALGLFGALVKIVTLPALAFAAVTPLLVPKRHRIYSIFLATALGGVLLAGGLSLGSGSSMVDGVPPLSVAGLRGGLDLVNGLLGPRWTSSLITQMALLGIAGAVWPTKHKAVKVLLVALAIVAFSFTAQTVSDKLRARYLIPASFPSLVLAGVLLGDLTRRLRRLSILAWLPVAGICLGLGFDSAAFLGNWSNLRARYQTIAPHQLPNAPFAYQIRYEQLPLLHLMDHSAVGATDLVRLAEQAPSAGIATIPLRDAREFHLSAAAGLRDIPYAILENGKCCGNARSADSCAESVIAQMDAIGAWLVLPTSAGVSNRIPFQHAQWLTRLKSQASALHPAEEGQWWWVWKGSGDAPGSVELPCRIGEYEAAPGRPPAGEMQRTNPRPGRANPHGRTP